MVKTSLPTRGAWIEIEKYPQKINIIQQSLPTRGAWIEIHGLYVICGQLLGRSPHGERGLKCGAAWYNHYAARSLPTRGAWIEIKLGNGIKTAAKWSLPTRGAWIEINICS